MKQASIVFVALILISGLALAQDEAPITKVTGEDELVQEKGAFQETWVHPGADISKYSKLYMWESIFQFREGGATSAGTTMEMMRGDQSGPYAVTTSPKKIQEDRVGGRGQRTWPEQDV